MRKLLFLYVISGVVTGKVFAQDVHFSQFYVAPQLINPSAFGAVNSFEAGMQYKGQWNSFTKGYTSYAAVVNKSFKKQNYLNSSKAYVSAGLNMIVDKAGDNQLSHLKVEIPVNVTKRIAGSSFLTAGLYLGYGQLSIKNNNYTWGNQFDGYQYNNVLSSNEGTMIQSRSYLDCGAGLSLISLGKEKDVTYVKNNLGFSVSHLNRPNYSLYENAGESLNMRINFYEYLRVNLENPSLSIIPSLLLQYQAKTYELVLGANLRKAFKESAESKQAVSMGVFYRMNDMCALNGMLELNKFNIGLNYDFNVSKLMTSSRSFGGLEISLKMNNPFRYVAPTSKTMDKQI